jgi:hypothetical protein
VNLFKFLWFSLILKKVEYTEGLRADTFWKLVEFRNSGCSQRKKKEKPPLKVTFPLKAIFTLKSRETL